jgi:hypothetical protein
MLWVKQCHLMHHLMPAMHHPPSGFFKRGMELLTHPQSPYFAWWYKLTISRKMGGKINGIVLAAFLYISWYIHWWSEPVYPTKYPTKLCFTGLWYTMPILPMIARLPEMRAF